MNCFRLPETTEKKSYPRKETKDDEDTRRKTVREPEPVPAPDTPSMSQVFGVEDTPPGARAARADPKFARGSMDYLRASAPQFHKNVFKKLKNHSPLEGESQKPSRMAKADAVGGRRRPFPPAPHSRDAALPPHRIDRGRPARILIRRWRSLSVSATLPAGSHPAGVNGIGRSK